MKKTLTLFALIILGSSAFAQVDSNETNNKNAGATATQSKQDDAAIMIERLENLVERNNTKIENLFFREEELMGYGGNINTSTVKVKNRIYEAGQKLIDAQKNKEGTTEEQKFQQLEEIVKVQDRMLFLVKQEKTRKLEKSLKKLDDPAEIAPVFFEDL